MGGWVGGTYLLLGEQTFLPAFGELGDDAGLGVEQPLARGCFCWVGKEEEEEEEWVGRVGEMEEGLSQGLGRMEE